MASEDNYDLKPEEKKETPASPARPKPGEPGWVEPKVVVEKADEPTLESHGEPSPFDAHDVEKNKAIAILGYIFFVIPLAAAPTSKFARFHANQGLLVFILWCVAVMGVIVLYFVDHIAWLTLGHIWILAAFFSCLIHLLQPAMLMGVLALMILGIVRAANGEGKGMPLIGHWTLIK